MNKPRWRDKWRALLDMKAAKNVAPETTLLGTMMDQVGASAATTTSPRPLKQGLTAWDEVEEWLEQMTMAQQYYHQHQKLSQSTSSTIYQNTNSPSQRYQETMATTKKKLTNSSSTSKTKTEGSAVLKPVTLIQNDQGNVSMTQKDIPITPSQLSNVGLWGLKIPQL